MRAPYVFAVTLLLLTPAAATAVDRNRDPAGDDAQLHDCVFVDAEFGWAVGDRGVIWHTEDGGETWRRQISGVDCPLRSVCFLSRHVGWVAGGTTQPYTHATEGVVMFTTDGGRRWLPRTRSELPALNRIKFFDDARGLALAEPSAVFPAGVFTTRDGGKSWQPMPGGASLGWAAGDFYDPTLGAVADQKGELSVVRRGSLEPSRTPALGLRTARAIRLVGQQYGWLAGDGGLLLQTFDVGRSWQLPGGPTPRGTSEHFDFAALAVMGNHVWAAGSPGTRVLHTGDGGRTWEWFETEQHAPITSLTFIDDRKGWAVGALGTILATSDGGHTWHRQKSGGTRSAILAIYADPQDVPWELLARLSGGEGYLSSVHLVGRRDPGGATREDVSLPRRTHETLVSLGGCRAQSAWQFPLPPAGLGWQPEQIVNVWNDSNDGRSLEELERRLVLQIRTWRPDVIFTYATTPNDKQPLGHLLNQVVLKAAEHAADATWYPEQGTAAGLKAWNTRKVFGSLPPGTLGEVNQETSQMDLRLGNSLADFAAVPRGMLENEPEPAAKVLGFHLYRDRIPQQGGRGDFMAGIVLHPGSEARRLLVDAPPEKLAAQRRAAQKRRNLESILARSDSMPQGTLNLMGQVGDLVSDLDDEMAGKILFTLAQQQYQQGHGDLAADTLQLLIDRYPEHPLVGKSGEWLVQYWSSGEWAWRAQREQTVRTQQGGFHLDPNLRLTSGTKSDDPIRLEVRQDARPAVESRTLTDRNARATNLGKWLQAKYPGLYSNPTTRFPLAAVDRNRGLPAQADRFYLNLRQGRVQDAWWACAEGERWLAKPDEHPPKQFVRCVRTQAKPRLDGQLNEPLWQQARKLSLKSPAHNDADWPADCLLARDDDFLYLAFECRKAPGFEYSEGKGPRPRDPDLSREDRVHLYIDLDRDYATWLHLVVDHRGWVAEDCWNDPTWNPEWYVARNADGESWRVEAALPLTELTGKLPKSNHVWCVNAVRTIPGVGFQTWSTPASPEVRPEGFGYLIFD